MAMKKHASTKDPEVRSRIAALTDARIRVLHMGFRPSPVIGGKSARLTLILNRLPDEREMENEFAENTDPIVVNLLGNVFVQEPPERIRWDSDAFYLHWLRPDLVSAESHPWVQVRENDVRARAKVTPVTSAGVFGGDKRIVGTFMLVLDFSTKPVPEKTDVEFTVFLGIGGGGFLTLSDRAVGKARLTLCPPEK